MDSSAKPSSQPDLAILPAGPRDPVHPAITEALISDLVEHFYAKVQQQETLGPLFDQRVDGNWPMHLDRMKRFWSSVLLKSGKYKGKPIPVHMAIDDIKPDDFRIWLELFEQTAVEVLGTDAAAPTLTATKRIAQSLWIAKFASPYYPVPQWLQDE